MNPSLEIDLLKQMLMGDLDIARRMLEIGDLAMCENAIATATTKLKQLSNLRQVLECGNGQTGSVPMPLSQCDCQSLSGTRHRTDCPALPHNRPRAIDV